MRVAIVNPNGAIINGETTYMLDLYHGLKRNGVEVDCIVPSKFGKRRKTEIVNENIKYIKTKNIDIINDYDIAHITNGKYHQNDYKKLNFDEINIPTTVMIHNETTYKSYNFLNLMRTLSPKCIFSNDPVSMSKLFDGIEKKMVGLLFDTQKPKAKHNGRYKLVCLSRFNFCKKIEDVMDVVNDLKTNINCHFYGSNSFYLNVIKDHITNRTKINPPFPDGTVHKVLKNSYIMFDATKFKKHSSRPQMTTLEAFHNEVVPAIRGDWIGGENLKNKKNVIDFQDKESIERVINDKDFRERIISNNKKVLSKYSCKNKSNLFIDTWKKYQK